MSARFGDQTDDVILGFKRHLDEGRTDCRRSLAHAVECSLEFVHKAGHLIEAEHRPGAFDGVQRPKSTVDQVAIVRGFTDIEQCELQLFQKLPRLLLEHIFRVHYAHAPATFLMTASNWSCLNGFTIQAIAPASLA
ncbi:hypothetical protein GALL_550320 [mine drainage metagenome]|uniref:Uncharacterized protein n=1 Tax=mine drainage metagenome TaxID=410659 RepID=A0A1J5NXC4_9ZZZZ